MATRCAPADVRAIMPETALTDPDIQIYINSANVYINAVTAGGEYTEETLFEMERWMSAHMIAMTQERVAKEEGAGGAYIKYAGDWGEGLMQTPYGQTVLNLDFNKMIDCIGCGDGDGRRKPKKASIYAVPGE